MTRSPGAEGLEGIGDEPSPPPPPPLPSPGTNTVFDVTRLLRRRSRCATYSEYTSGTHASRGWRQRQRCDRRGDTAATARDEETGGPTEGIQHIDCQSADHGQHLIVGHGPVRLLPTIALCRRPLEATFRCSTDSSTSSLVDCPAASASSLHSSSSLVDYNIASESSLHSSSVAWLPTSPLVLLHGVTLKNCVASTGHRVGVPGRLS